MVAVALSIAGSDPSGGAGVQADLKTFHQHGVYGCAVISLVTAQSTRELTRVEGVTPDLLAEQLRVLLDDIQVHAVKTGALGSPQAVQVVVERLAAISAPLVIDPVMIAKQGADLLSEEACRIVVEKLLPRAALVTPNLAEAAALTGKVVETDGQIEVAARELVELGAGAALIKGGHRRGDPTDLLFVDGQCHRLEGKRVETRHTHGVGCTLSAAITARLARGEGLVEACAMSKQWLQAAIASAPGLGAGAGPVDHLAELPDDGQREV